MCMNAIITVVAIVIIILFIIWLFGLNTHSTEYFTNSFKLHDDEYDKNGRNNNDWNNNDWNNNNWNNDDRDRYHDNDNDDYHYCRCGNRSLKTCLNCKNCGLCFKNRSLECVGGNQRGPFFKNDCKYWQHKDRISI